MYRILQKIGMVMSSASFVMIGRKIESHGS